MFRHKLCVLVAGPVLALTLVGCGSDLPSSSELQNELLDTRSEAEQTIRAALPGVWREIYAADRLDPVPDSAECVARDDNDRVFDCTTRTERGSPLATALATEAYVVTVTEDGCWNAVINPDEGTVQPIKRLSTCDELTAKQIYPGIPES